MLSCIHRQWDHTQHCMSLEVPPIPLARVCSVKTAAQLSRDLLVATKVIM